MAIETLQSAYDRNPTIAGLREAFVAANAAIWEQSLRIDELRGMGTTLTAAGLTVGPTGGTSCAWPTWATRAPISCRAARSARSPPTTAWPRSGSATAR